MGWFTTLCRCCLHALQLGGAIAACVFYASTYDGVTKDYRWKFAITTGAFSIVGTIIQSIFRGCLSRHFDTFWISLSGQCSGILFFFWTGVLGTFATSFIHLDAGNNYGIRMMQIAVYVDAANMFIWFLTVVDMIVVGVRYEPRQPVRPAGGVYPLAGYGANSSTLFIPHGWDAADIEAQTLAIQIEHPPLHQTTEMSETHLSISHLILPELPPPAVTTESGRNVTHSRDMEGGRPSSDILPLLPEELQNFLLMPSVRLPGTLDWPLQEPEPSSVPLQLSLKPRAYTDPSKHLTGHPSYERIHDLHDHLESYDTATSSEPPKPSQRNVSWPLSFEWDEPTKECPICAEERPSWTGFPFRIAKACSNHEQESCRVCIDRSIMAELDSSIYGPIHCAECRAVLDYEEVKILASPATFVRYERMGLRGFVSNDPNFVWCQNRNCPSGQEHVGGVDQPIMTCQACGFKTCFKHQIPWHEEMLCDEYDERVRLSNDERQSRAQQELASITAIHKVTKPCANKLCKAPIQKTEGCDHMSCSRCKYEFCWLCGEDWRKPHRLGCAFR